ncbi:ABC-type branched-chain amino acid transport systems periplasmic component-like protein [Parafrankia sp. EUN1f]|nr:ABC-type branched-chain amino acid transport systems periplasmic component-like protein [Parafrankia sp. EUN1f]
MRALAGRCAVAVTVPLLLSMTSACSGSSGAPAAESCVAPGVTADQVRIGFVYPDTGTDAGAFSAARGGVEARVGLANEQGGINGRQVSYEWRDDQMSTETNRRVVGELVDDVGVAGLVATSFTMSGSAAFLAERGVPVTGAGTEPVWSQYENMFVFANMSGSVDTWGRYLRNNGGTRALIVIPENVASTAIYADRLSLGLRAAGVIPAGIVQFTEAAQSPQRVAEAFAGAGADVLVSIIDPPVLAGILNALRSAGATLRATLSVPGYSANLLGRYGPALAGVSIMSYVTPLELGGPAAEQYAAAIAHHAPQVGNPEQEFTIRSYIETDMLLRAVAAAGECPDRESVIRALDGMRDYDAGGLIQPTDLSDSRSQPQNCLAFVRVNDAGNSFDVVDRRLCGNVLPAQ